MDFKNIKTYAQVCEIEGVDPVQSLPHPSPVNSDEVSTNAYAMVKRIVRVITNNQKENKYYYPWWYKAGSGGGLSFIDLGCDGSVPIVGVPLCYCSADQVRHAAKYFKDIYEVLLVD